MKPLHRRHFLHVAAGAVTLPATLRIARAQSYPTRPVRIIVTFAAGSSNDVHGRLFGQWLSERLGQPFFVDNRPGGGGTLGVAQAVRLPADGYTLLILSISHAVNENLYDKLPYSILHDVTPIASVFRANYVMVVNPTLPVKTVPEFIAYAKANPGKINMGSQGIGSIGHLAGELFKSMAGVDMVHVPYRDVTLALLDAISGRMHVQFATSTESIPFIREGKIRALAVTSKVRSPALADVPVMSEYLPDYEFESWIGFAGPKAIPPEIVQLLNREINAGLARPEIKAKYDDLGLRIYAGSPSDFSALIAADVEKWAKVIKNAGIKPM
jgi:tripartite-type tricarboxylate transporter receptor subunit TctC